MKRLNLLLIPAVILLSGCFDKEKKHLDGKLLLEKKCSSCHNLDLPPKTYEDELAPPMMAVSFHVVSFMQTPDESARVSKAVDFVKDYVINPSEEKSFCDKKSLQDYGLMPSQKGNVTEDELEAIARYMFEHFTQDNLNKEQEKIRKFKAMPLGKRVAVKNNCLTCHRADKDLVGPSFNHIAQRYKDSPDIIKSSIKKGSSKKWQSSRKAVMPSFKNISDKELNILTKWVMSLKSD
jgi:cytochrome c